MATLKPLPKGEEVTDSITKHIDKRFLSSIDLIGQGEVAMVIDRVEHHANITYANGKKDEKVNLIYFVGTDKPLALNVTNIKSIVSLVGSNKVSDWKGKKIKLAVKKVKAFDEVKDAVRVIG